MFGAIELLGDQTPIPRQNGIGFGNAPHFSQRLAPQPLRDLG
jgi:hypothetical protein